MQDQHFSVTYLASLKCYLRYRRQSVEKTSEMRMVKMSLSEKSIIWATYREGTEYFRNRLGSSLATALVAMFF